MSYLIRFACAYCQGSCKRKGRSGAAQLLRCACCGKYQRSAYRRLAYQHRTDERIATLTREGCGIRSIGRVLSISPTTVIARIKRIAAGLGPGFIPKCRDYEVDELVTCIGSKMNRIWVAYAWERTERRVVAMRIGSRSKRHLGPLIDTLLLSEARSIRTDGLDIYRSLIPHRIHRALRFGTNGIERMNLTLRTRLKRLARRTISYSKSTAMLHACVAIACWG